MGLVARELESRGIATVCVMLLREVAEKVRPPRTLLVPFGRGQPLGPPGQAELHRRVVEAALSMLEEGGGGGRIEGFDPDAGRGESPPTGGPGGGSGAGQ